MKILHIHVAVENLERSIGFYSTLFALDPAVRKPDYAKWMLDDPCVNFAISQRGREAGVDHLGIQVETPEELQLIRDRLDIADGPVLHEGDAACCYAQSNKSWIVDPSGISWETFLTTGENTYYGDGQERGEAPTAGAGTRTAWEVSVALASPQQPGNTACCGPSAQDKSAISAST